MAKLWSQSNQTHFIRADENNNLQFRKFSSNLVIKKFKNLSRFEFLYQAVEHTFVSLADNKLNIYNNTVLLWGKY